MKRCMKLIKGGVAIALTVITVMGFIPGTDFVMTAHAAQSNKTSISGLGTGAITNPTPSAGGWSYVYYGKYNGNDMKFRVLDRASTDFGGNTMLLDCDTIIEQMKFADSNSSVWANCDIYTWLNGNSFYGNSSVFTTQEKIVIASSTKASPASEDGDGWELFVDYAPLTGETIFLLDAKEITRPSYGYVNWSGDSNRIKTGADTCWWLRSPLHGYTSQVDIVNHQGTYLLDQATQGIVSYNTHGVSPAFNLNLSSIIFSSVLNGTAGTAGAEYKLTIKDDNLTIAKTGGLDVEREGNVVTVPYTITGSNAGEATQVSVLLTDGPYSAGEAASTGYSYQKLDVTTWGTSGTGTFTVPDAYANRVCGTNYYAYILAEDVNDNNATDYASAPVAISIPSLPGAQATVTEEAESTQPDTPDYLEALYAKLAAAIALGGPQTIYWSEGTALPGPVMKLLLENPQITLIFSYTYQGLDYTVTLPGKNVKYDPNVPWCGPLYLYGLYGKYSASTPVTTTATTSGSRTYTIISGETLWGIANRLGTTVDELVRLNNITNPDRIDIGQIIRY